ncbi:MAG: DNA-directed DNA polymerase II small subunit [Thermoplasmata archaeon]
MREIILEKFAEKNTMLSPEGWKYLDEEFENPYPFVQDILNAEDSLPFPVGRKFLQSYVEKGYERKIEDIDNKLEEVKEEIRSEENIKECIDVLTDISGNSTCTGELKDFTKYFNNRYEKIRSILERRREASGVMDIARIKKRKGDATIIAMVGDISTTSSGNKMLSLEDRSGQINGFISSGSPAFDKDLLDDEVIIAIGSVWEKKKHFETTFAINDFIRPGIPKIIEEPSYKFEGKIAFTGDIHVGSTEFLEKEWERFIDWMKYDESAKDIRYLIVAGDLIDGIGVYPNQEDELVIKDVFEQYRALAKMFKNIPQRVKIICIPGNHDVVRNPEPQPALPEEIQEIFPSNVIFLGNPSMFKIEDVSILMYHGGSINDLSDMLIQVDTDHPITAMKEMLKRRHLVPVYGKKTPLAPEEEDMLVMKDLPDIFVTGHIHKTQIQPYHNMILINSSSWQGQTEYQEMRDIQPDPGKVIVFEPRTRKATIQNFCG